jgi:hypothetical protein
LLKIVADLKYETEKKSARSYQLSAISYQLSAISYQLSENSQSLSLVGCINLLD